VEPSKEGGFFVDFFNPSKWLWYTRIKNEKDKEWVKQNEETTSYRHRRTDGSRKNEDRH